jgi:hypothetical protein
MIYIFLYIISTINRGWPKWGKVSHHSLVRCEWAIPKLYIETIFKIILLILIFFYNLNIIIYIYII